MLELLGCHLVRCNSRLSRRAADTHVDGPSPAAVDEHAASAAAGGTRVFLYLVPTFANPTGRCLSIARQHDLLKVARTRGIHVIEDDVYRDTTPNPPPSMWSLDHDTLTRLGSFSKSLSPGLRVGFITDGEKTVERIGNCGLLDSGGSVNHLASMVVGEMMHSGSFRDVASTGQQLFAGRRAALSAAFDPSLFTFVRPDGGYFLWLELPEGVTSARAVVAARQHGVQVSDGRNFYVDRTDRTAVRVSFSMLDAELLVDGAERLNRAVSSLIP